MWINLFRCTACGMLIEFEDQGGFPIVPDPDNDPGWELEPTRHYADCSFVSTRNFTRSGRPSVTPAGRRRLSNLVATDPAGPFPAI